MKSLKENDIKIIQEELAYSKKPLFFFHDDADGLCSFLLFYRKVKEGKGVIIKTNPNIDSKFYKVAKEFDPDKIFVLDIAKVEQEFIDEIKKPLIWLDHHEPEKRQRAKYFNPRLNGANVPASKLCYDVVEQDLWIAMVGCVGDWHMPDFADEFKKKYPYLLDKKVKRPEEALFNSELGKLVKIFNFVLKGTSRDALKYVKVLTRIETPEEILEQKTAQGKFIYKRFAQVNKDYDALLDDIRKNVNNDKLLVYTYKEDKMSFTGDVTNELLYLYPDKVIIVGREKSGEYKCSLRSPAGITISEKLSKALVNIQGYGGGHENACGAVIKKEDFETFLNNFREELGFN